MVMNRAMPYVVCDTDGTPVTAEQAECIIAEKWTVPERARARRRSTKTKAGKVSQQVHTGHDGSDAHGADERGGLLRQRSSAGRGQLVKQSALTAARR